MDRQSLWNWTKAALGLREVRGALQVLVSHHFNTFYESLPCSQSNSSCTSKHRTILPVHSDGYTCYKKKCTCKTSKGEHCPVCSYTYGMIVEEMSNSSQMPALNNCKTEKWSTNQWEVAKAFIVGSGYKDIDSAKRTDVSAIIGICMNASCIRKYLQQKDLDAFQKVREIRNMIFHSCDLDLQEKEMNDSLQSMFDMLDDNLESNKLIKEAFTTAKQKLKKLPEEPLCEHCLERIDCSRDALAALEADTKQLLNELEQSQPENNQDIQDKLTKLLESQNVHFSRISVEEQKMDNTLEIVSSLSVQMESSVTLRKEIADRFKRQGLTMEPSLQTVLNHGVKVYRPKYSHVNSENIKTKNEDDKVMVAVSEQNETKNEDDTVMVQLSAEQKLPQEMASIKDTVTDMQKKERDQEQRLWKLTKPHMDVLERWIGTGPKRFQLLYSIKRDGCVGELFHRICDNKGPTVQVLYNLNGCIYGGYTSISWASDDTYKPDDNAFLFQLMFKGISQQNKFPVKKGSQCATYNRIAYGPTYGLSHDFCCFRGKIQPSNGVFILNGHMWNVGIDYETNGLTAHEINDNSLDVTELEVYTVTDLV